jgi:hypothetical protein
MGICPSHEAITTLNPTTTQTTGPIKDPISGRDFPHIDDFQSGSISTNLKWIDALTLRASILRQRAGLTHRELMNLLETNFVQAAVTSPAKIQLTGDESDAGRMRIKKVTISINGTKTESSLTESEATNALRRIHLFVKLWRKLSWNMRDLDRTFSVFPNC